MNPTTHLRRTLLGATFTWPIASAGVVTAAAIAHPAWLAPLALYLSTIVSVGYAFGWVADRKLEVFGDE